MEKEQFKKIRTDLGLSVSQMALALRLKSCRNVRYYESGERPVSGPISRLMEIYRLFPGLLK